MNRPTLAPDTALFLDFDGTLAPIQKDPDTVYLPEDGAALLADVGTRLRGALAIVSGRDIRDLAARIPDSLWRAGGHGAHICAPGETPPSHLPEAPESLVTAARALCARLDGVRLELKGKVLALHYRAAPDAQDALLEGAALLAAAADGYEVQAGKMVAELRPAGIHKGEVIRQLMRQPSFEGRRPLMVGDDTTDEDAMAVCLEMGGSAVRVGGGETLAPHRLEDTPAVWNWLKEAVK